MSKVEVEYTRTKKRKRIQKHYADVLVKMGLVKLVPSHDKPKVAPVVKPPRRDPAADLQDAKVEAQVESATKGSIEPASKKRTYKRRDLNADKE